MVGVYNMSSSGLRAGSGVTVGVLGGFIGIHYSLATSALTLSVVALCLLVYTARASAGLLHRPRRSVRLVARAARSSCPRQPLAPSDSPTASDVRCRGGERSSERRNLIWDAHGAGGYRNVPVARPRRQERHMQRRPHLE